MIACVVIPFFAASIEHRLQHALADDLFVLSEMTKAVRRVAAVSKQAAQLDIRRGMVVRHAQTIVSEINVLPLNPPAYRQHLEGLINTFCTFSDRIEIAYKGWGAEDAKVKLSSQFAESFLNPAVVFIDLGSLKPRSLYQLGQQLQEALRCQGFSAQVGIASNRFTAWVVAQAAREGEVVLVMKGEEQWALTCHPVSLLPLDEKVLRRLGWLGIRTLGDYAGLPSAAIRVQFGKLGQVAYQLAQGRDPTSIPQWNRQGEISRSFTFENPVTDRQTVDELLDGLLTDLATSLTTSANTARTLRLTISLDNRGVGEWETRLRRRTSALPQLRHKLQTLLDRIQLTAPIIEVSLTLGDIVPVAAQQLELFPAMRLVETRDSVLDDLVARYGQRFYTAAVTDEQSLLPENQVEFKTVDIA